MNLVSKPPDKIITDFFKFKKVNFGVNVLSGPNSGGVNFGVFFCCEFRCEFWCEFWHGSFVSELTDFFSVRFIHKNKNPSTQKKIRAAEKKNRAEIHTKIRAAEKKIRAEIHDKIHAKIHAKFLLEFVPCE